MDNIVFRFANKSDFKNVLNFIKDYWDSNSIFLDCPELMEHEYMRGDKFNFVIGEDRETNKIYGLLGYLVYNEEEKSDVTTCLWRTINSSRQMLGFEMLNFLKEQLNPRIYFSCGIRPKTLPVYALLRWPTGILNHYYRIADKETYKIAVIENKEIISVKEGKYTLKYIPDFEAFKKSFIATHYKERVPYKDLSYLEKRYFTYPIYSYKVYGIDKGKDTFDSIIITREITHNNTKVLRIADFIGIDSDLSEIGQEIQKLIELNNYEYVEFYNYGIGHDIMVSAGFTLRKEHDNNIIPSHFEPFEQKNIEHFFFAVGSEDMYIFKGDSNQDTPRILLNKNI